MLRLLALIFSLACAVACNTVTTKADTDYIVPVMEKDLVPNQVIQQARFNAFDTTFLVIYQGAKDSSEFSDCQKKNYRGFILKQDSLFPEILQKLFDFYKFSYPDYKLGATIGGPASESELETFLPKPTTPARLKSFLTPAAIYISSKKDCREGCFSILFDCSWDLEHGIGVEIKNWQVMEGRIGSEL